MRKVALLLIVLHGLTACTIKIEPIAKKKAVTYHHKKHVKYVSKPTPTPHPILTHKIVPATTAVPDWPQDFKLLKTKNPELEPDANN